MMVPIEKFREAIKKLHYTKDSVYRNAWKKRGEVLSILANIARKVDRLESAADGVLSTPDETFLDTVIDLFVYCLKYQTFLADQDTLVADTLFNQSKVKANYSDGPAGFEFLLAQVDLAKMDTINLTEVEGVSQIIICFGELELCFSGLNSYHSATYRLAHVQRLIEATLNLIAVLKHNNSLLYRDFVLSHTQGTV